VIRLTLKELIDARLKAHTFQIQLNDEVEARDGEYTAEEQEKWDKADKEFIDLSERIKKAQEVEERREIFDAVVDTPVEDNVTSEDTREVRTGHVTDRPEYRDLFADYLRTGQLMPELRAMQAEAGGDMGGYVVTPQSILAGIWEKARDDFFVRKWARVISMPSAESLGVVTLETRPSVPPERGEIEQASAEVSTRLGKRALTPHRHAQYIYISNQLLRQSFEAFAPFITDQFSYVYNYELEDNYLNGDGVQESLGVFTADAAGISTSRDYSTGNTTSAVVADNLIGCVYNEKPRYRVKSRWLLNRTGIRKFRQIKDGNGQYIWQPGLAPPEPDRLLGYPVDESELVPDTWSTGRYVGIFGDWSHYVIVDSLAFQMKRLEELRALEGQTVFVGEIYTDGMPIHEEAFTRVTLG